MEVLGFSWRAVSSPRGTALAGLALVALIAAAACHMQAAYGARAVAEDNAVLKRQLQRHERSAAALSTDRDYVSGLTSVPLASPEALAHELQVTADGDSGVSVVSVSAALTAGTSQSLPREDVALTLHGDYAHLKAGLTELFQRHANVVLRHLSLKRLQPTGDQLEAQVVLSLLNAPAPNSIAAAAR